MDQYVIIKDKTRLKNVAIAWINYKMANDEVRKLKMTVGGQTIAEIKIQRTTFQGNSLSLLLFLTTTYVVHSISFQTFFFVQEFKIVVDSWQFSMLLLYILWDDWPIFMISASNEQLQQQLEYTLLNSDCHSWWISKMQSGREDTLEERYAINLCFKLGKNAATETYGMLQTDFRPS